MSRAGKKELKLLLMLSMLQNLEIKMRYVGSYSVAFYLHIILLLVYTMDEDLNLIPFLSLHLSMYLSTCASLSPTLPSCFYSYLLTYLLLTSLLFFFFFSLSLSLSLSVSVSLFLSHLLSLRLLS